MFCIYDVKIVTGYCEANAPTPTGMYFLQEQCYYLDDLETPY